VRRKLLSDSLRSKDGIHIVYPESRAQGVCTGDSRLAEDNLQSYRPQLTLG
jgi:hypothetical protein